MEDTLSNQFYNLTSTLARLENMRDELGNEIKEDLKWLTSNMVGTHLNTTNFNTN